MTFHFTDHPLWGSGNNQSVRSSVPVVSRWLSPGNRTSFLEVAGMVATWWIVFFAQCTWNNVAHFHAPNPNWKRAFESFTYISREDTQKQKYFIHLTAIHITVKLPNLTKTLFCFIYWWQRLLLRQESLHVYSFYEMNVLVLILKGILAKVNCIYIRLLDNLYSCVHSVNCRFKRGNRNISEEIIWKSVTFYGQIDKTLSYKSDWEQYCFT